MDFGGCGRERRVSACMRPAREPPRMRTEEGVGVVILGSSMDMLYPGAGGSGSSI